MHNFDWKAWDQGDQPDAVPVETVLEIVQKIPKALNTQNWLLRSLTEGFTERPLTAELRRLPMLV